MSTPHMGNCEKGGKHDWTLCGEDVNEQQVVRDERCLRCYFHRLYFLSNAGYVYKDCQPDSCSGSEDGNHDWYIDGWYHYTPNKCHVEKCDDCDGTRFAYFMCEATEHHDADGNKFHSWSG